MRHLFELMFPTPPLPPIVLPCMANHIAEGVMSTISEAFRLVYVRGVYDGFVGGVLVALLLAPHARRKRGD